MALNKETYDCSTKLQPSQYPQGYVIVIQALGNWLEITSISAM